MVRLKETRLAIKSSGEFYFNSYMVRLKGFLAQTGVSSVYKFQFLYGTIKRLGHSRLNLYPNDFNSYMVLLKEMRGYILKLLILISIPIWYD